MAKTIHGSEYQILREMIRQARESINMTQVELSKQLGRSQTFISNFEQSDRRIDVLELREVCRLLNQDFVGFLVEFELKVSKSRLTRNRQVKNK